MLQTTRRIRRGVAVGVTILAIGVPSAQASLDTPGGARPTAAMPTPAPTPVVVQQVPAASGFAWRDAAIGASTTGGVIALVALAGLAGTRLRRAEVPQVEQHPAG